MPDFSLLTAVIYQLILFIALVTILTLTGYAVLYPLLKIIGWLANPAFALVGILDQIQVRPVAPIASLLAKLPVLRILHRIKI